MCLLPNPSLASRLRVHVCIDMQRQRYKYLACMQGSAKQVQHMHRHPAKNIFERMSRSELLGFRHRRKGAELKTQQHVLTAKKKFPDSNFFLALR